MSTTTLATLLDRTIERHEARAAYLGPKVHGPDMRNTEWKWSPTQVKAQLARAVTVQRRRLEVSKLAESAGGR